MNDNFSIAVPAQVSKDYVNQVAGKFITLFDSGTVDSLPLYIALKAASQAIDIALKAGEQYAKVEVDRYNENSFPCAGATVAKTIVGVKYDYSNDTKWQKLKEKADKANAELKAQEKALQVLGQYVKTGKESFSVTIK